MTFARPVKVARRSFWTAAAPRFLAWTASVGALTVLTLGLLAASGLHHRIIDSAELRERVSLRLSQMAGPEFDVHVGSLSLGFDAGSMMLVLRDSTVSSRSGMRVPIEQVDVGVRMAPLLREQLEFSAIRVAGVRLDATQFARKPETFKWQTLLANANVHRGLRELAEPLRVLERTLRTHKVDTLAVEEVFVSGFGGGVLASDELVLDRLRIDLDARYRIGLTATATARLGGETLTAAADWLAPNDEGEGRSLSASVSGIDLGQLPRVLTAGHTPLEIDAPLRVGLRAPFDADGRPGHAHAALRIGSGRIWFGDPAPTPLANIVVNLRFDPARNSVAVRQSRIATSPFEARFEGGIAQVDGELDFEFVTTSLTSRAGGVVEPEHGGLSVAGRFDIDAGTVALEQLRFVGDGGSFEAKGLIDVARWTPGVRMEASVPHLNVETMKAFWPPFVAYRVRRWLTDGAVEGGTIVNASVLADIPAGTIGELRRGGTLQPNELSMTIPVEGTKLRTVGDLPRVVDASGTAHVVGVSVSGSLATGRVISQGKGAVELGGSRLSIGDYLLKGLPAQLHVVAKGEGRALLTLAATRPLKISQSIGIRPDDARGVVDLKADVETPLITEGRAVERRWSAALSVRDGSLAEPYKGRRVTKADLDITARAGRVRVNGTASIDGVRTRLSLTETFGSQTDGARSRQQIALRLNDSDRRRLKLGLDEYVRGPVDVRLVGEPDGWQRADVDLNQAALSFDPLAWRKGRGVPARATFRFRTSNGRTQIKDLRLSGREFGASGNLTLDRKGLRIAQLTGVKLSKDRGLSVEARRTKSGYTIDVRGERYDARALLAHLFDSAPKARGAKVSLGKGGPAIDLSARFDEVVGHKDVNLTNAALRLQMRGSQINALRLDASAGGKALRVRMKRKGTNSSIAVSGEDAGRALRFTDLYDRMSGGLLTANLEKNAEGEYVGAISVTNFTVRDEPKLTRMIAGTSKAGGRIADRVKVAEASAIVRKSDRALVVGRGRFRAGDMAATFEGTVYDRRGQSKIKGTFLPAYGLNRMVSAIPFVGLAAGSGRKRGLLGITFRLNGPWRSPALTVNPLSVFAPGVFRKIFE